MFIPTLLLLTECLFLGAEMTTAASNADVNRAPINCVKWLSRKTAKVLQMSDLVYYASRPAPGRACGAPSLEQSARNGKNARFSTDGTSETREVKVVEARMGTVSSLATLDADG